MDKLLVILRKSPYGMINAAEAVRHAGAAAGFDYKAMLYLVDSGVYTAKKGQDTAGTGFSGLGENLELLADQMDIYACQNSLKERGLKNDDLLEGVKVDDGEVLKQALNNAQSIMIF